MLAAPIISFDDRPSLKCFAIQFVINRWRISTAEKRAVSLWANVLWVALKIRRMRSSKSITSQAGAKHTRFACRLFHDSPPFRFA